MTLFHFSYFVYTSKQKLNPEIFFLSTRFREMEARAINTVKFSNFVKE